MKKSDYFLKSLLSAIGVLLYITAVAWLLFNGQRIFGEPRTFLMPLFMLLLFVISAATTGLLVLGKPIHLYLNGFKKEAFILFSITLAWLVLFAIVVVFILLLR